MGIKGFIQLKNVPPGNLIRFRNGTYAMTTEYGFDTDKGYDAYILESGEAVATSGDTWVAIIDIDVIEVEIGAAEINYPNDEIPPDGLVDMIRNRETSIAYYEQQHGFNSEELLRRKDEGTLPETYEIQHWLILLEYRKSGI